MDPKSYAKACMWAKFMTQFVLAWKKAPNQINRPILVEEMIQNNQKIVFSVLFWGIWAPLNGPKKVLKGLQVGVMYGPMSKLKKKPLNKSIGPFL